MCVVIFVPALKGGAIPFEGPILIVIPLKPLILKGGAKEREILFFNSWG
jgi:hypothetical protein